MSEVPQSAISDAEREVLKVLWDHGPMGVREVLQCMLEVGQQWTRSTVVTLLSRLEAKGYVACDRSQYAFVYSASVAREDLMHAKINEVAEQLSDGGPVPLMLAFAERHKFTPDELSRLQQMIDDLKRRARRK